MANKKITELTNLQTPVANSEFVVVDAENDETKSLTFANLTSSILTDSGVTAGLYGGVIGTSTNVAALTIGADGRVTAAANVTVAVDLPTLEANVNTVSANVVAVEARRAANVVIFTNEDTALQSRLTTNVSAFTSEDTALQARLTTNVTTFTNEDTALQSRLTTNVGITTAVEARRVANVTVMTDEDTALQARITANSTAFQTEDTALQARITANNVLATAIETRRAANLVSATFTGQVNMSDDLVVAGNLTVNGDTTTVNTTNLDVADRIIMLANGVSGSPSADVGILFNRGNQGNAAIIYDESAQTFKFSDTKDPKSNTSLSPVTASNISVGILDAATIKYNGADLNTAISTNVTTLSDEATAIQARLTTNVGITTAVEARRVANVTVMTDEDTALQARITANAAITTAVEARRVANIAGAISSVLTGDLTASRALVSDTSGKIAISDITSTELAFLDGLDQNLNSNLQALASGIQGIATSSDAPTGDYGLLDAANAATDSFGVATAGLTTFDMKTEPAGSLNTQDLGAF